MYQGKYYKGMTRAYSFQQKNSTKEITKKEQEYIYLSHLARWHNIL